MPNIIRLPRNTALLPDNANYVNRFEIRSESSDRVYVVAQSRNGRWWSCGCHGWIRYKRCKHLTALGLPGNHTPHEAQIEGAA